MSNQDEIERLKRIRDQQLAARDPGNKERKLQSQIAAKNKRAQSKQNFWKDSAKSVPKALSFALIGVVIGLVILLLLPIFIKDIVLSSILGFLAMIALGVLGAMLGSSFDWRDRMRDL